MSASTYGHSTYAPAHKLIHAAAHRRARQEQETHTYAYMHAHTQTHKCTHAYIHPLCQA